MDINATLFGQMITFAIFVWFTMKYVWPPMVKAMAERRKKIAEGLAAAEEGEQHLQEAQRKFAEVLAQAKQEAQQIVKEAHDRGQHIIEEARQKAMQEGERLIQVANDEIQQQANVTRQQLMSDVSKIAVLGAEKIIRHNLDAASNEQLVNDIIGEI